MPGAREEPIEIEAKGMVRPAGVASARRVHARCALALNRHWWCWLMLGFVGCGAATPLPPPAPPPPPPPVVEAPPPKCEKVEEACVAGAETRARIGQVGWQFAPPASWIYAQGDDLTSRPA